MMTDPRRLVEEGTELEMRLLASALEDAPGRGLERRVQAAVGIGSIAVGAGTASTTAAAASKAIPLFSLVVAKWVGIVAIGTGAVVGVAIVRPKAGLQHAPIGSGSPTRPRGAALGAAMAASPSNAAQPLVPAIAPVAISPPVSPPATLDRAGVASTTNHSQAPAASPSAGVPTETTTDLVSELAMLDSAHKALDSSDTQLALATLDRHDLEFAHGDLAPESLVLRIEAYAQRRDGAKVRELGQTFLSRYPSHPQSGRVQLLIDGSVHR
jgi:hypothetical protein